MSYIFVEISKALSMLGDATGAEEAARSAFENAATHDLINCQADALVAWADALAAMEQEKTIRTASEDALAISRSLSWDNGECSAGRALASEAVVLNDVELEAYARGEAARIDTMLTWPQDVEFLPLGLAEDAG